MPSFSEHMKQSSTGNAALWDSTDLVQLVLRIQTICHVISGQMHFTRHLVLRQTKRIRHHRLGQVGCWWWGGV